MCKVFFFCCAPLGAAIFRRGQSKKQFFFAPAPGKGKGRRSPVGSRHGARAKKKHHPKKKTFCSGPVPAPNGASPSPGPEQKKHPGWCFFFALAPCRLPTGLLLPLPFAGAAATKKTPWVVFFVCSGPVPASKGASPSLAFRRGRSKKKTPWVVFFFLLRPRADAHSLTAGLGGDASPSPGRCFFFLLRPRPDRGGVFFLLWPRPDAHSLTVGWGDFGKARVVFFFLLRPRRVFLDNSKKCLGYYIGSKKTRRGHSKKKNTTSPQPSTLKGWGLGPTA